MPWRFDCYIFVDVFIIQISLLSFKRDIVYLYYMWYFYEYLQRFCSCRYLNEYYQVLKFRTDLSANVRTTFTEIPLTWNRPTLYFFAQRNLNVQNDLRKSRSQESDNITGSIDRKDRRADMFARLRQNKKHWHNDCTTWRHRHNTGAKQLLSQWTN